jgi:hypothetical protein
VLLNILLIIFNMSVSKNVSTDSSTTFIEIGEDDNHQKHNQVIPESGIIGEWSEHIAQRLWRKEPYKAKRDKHNCLGKNDRQTPTVIRSSTSWSSVRARLILPVPWLIQNWSSVSARLTIAMSRLRRNSALYSQSTITAMSHRREPLWRNHTISYWEILTRLLNIWK